jgi:hypothetical protein
MKIVVKHPNAPVEYLLCSPHEDVCLRGQSFFGRFCKLEFDVFLSGLHNVMNPGDEMQVGDLVIKKSASDTIGFSFRGGDAIQFVYDYIYQNWEGKSHPENTVHDKQEVQEAFERWYEQKDVMMNDGRTISWSPSSGHVSKEFLQQAMGTLAGTGVAATAVALANRQPHLDNRVWAGVAATALAGPTLGTMAVRRWQQRQV